MQIFNLCRSETGVCVYISVQFILMIFCLLSERRTLVSTGAGSTIVCGCALLRQIFRGNNTRVLRCAASAERQGRFFTLHGSFP